MSDLERTEDTFGVVGSGGGRGRLFLFVFAGVCSVVVVVGRLEHLTSSERAVRHVDEKRMRVVLRPPVDHTYTGTLVRSIIQAARPLARREGGEQVAAGVACCRSFLPHQRQRVCPVGARVLIGVRVEAVATRPIQQLGMVHGDARRRR